MVPLHAFEKAQNITNIKFIQKLFDIGIGIYLYNGSMSLKNYCHLFRKYWAGSRDWSLIIICYFRNSNNMNVQFLHVPCIMYIVHALKVVL